MYNVLHISSIVIAWFSLPIPKKIEKYYLPKKKRKKIQRSKVYREMGNK